MRMLIELAGVPVEVRCAYAENEAFFRDYAVSKPQGADLSQGANLSPCFTIAPTAVDLARMQADFDRTAAVEGTTKRTHAPAFLENNAIHALLAEQLIHYDVLLMHGSALCMDGQGYIFTAKSGTGKSTHARLWREAFGERVWMINDDKPMLKITEAGVTVHGTPWNGKHHLSRNAAAPLKAIIALSRDDTNHIEPMSRADAFPVLMKQCFGSRDPATMARIIELERRLLNAVDFYRLGCNMSQEAAFVAWGGLSGIPKSDKGRRDE